jgi:uncharacterized protein (TIGR00251 family)
VNQSLVSISVRVYPNAAGNEVAGFSDGVFQVKVAAPPVQGKANRELVAFLGKALGISKNRVSITRGHTTRNKLITIDGLSEADVERRLLLGA